MNKCTLCGKVVLYRVFVFDDGKDGLGETIKLMGCSECTGKSNSKLSLSGTVAKW